MSVSGVVGGILGIPVVGTSVAIVSAVVGFHEFLKHPSPEGALFVALNALSGFCGLRGLAAGAGGGGAGLVPVLVGGGMPLRAATVSQSVIADTLVSSGATNLSVNLLMAETGDGDNSTKRLHVIGSPADVAGTTPIKPSDQGAVRQSIVEKYANDMKQGTFDWFNMERGSQPDIIKIIRARNGQFIEEGHHRFLASRLAGVSIPDDPRVIEYKDYPNIDWPVGSEWATIQWDGF